MEANELRVGNWVNSELRGEVYTILVNGICSYGINETINEFEGVFKKPMCDEGSIEPIPLNEEWLKRFGFEGHPYNSDWMCVDVNGGELQLTKAGLSVCYLAHGQPFNIGVSCKHVHQLQNLYHALTGKELILDSE
jgi:hypothetical protein